jgi:WD40 repeat protein
LDEELAALPDRLRGPLVLCYLDGLTQDEAAGRFGWSLATLKRRLDEGRGRLRARLLRRGVPAAVLAAAVQADGLRATVPPALPTRAAALPFGPAPGSVNALAAGLGAVAMPALGHKTVVGVMVTLVSLAALLLLPRVPPPTPDPPAPDEVEVAPAPPPVVLTKPATRIGSLRFRLPSGSDGSALSADGKVLATAAHMTVIVWDLETGERRHVFRDSGAPGGFGSGEPQVALSPDGTLLAQASVTDVQVRVWDLATGTQVAGIGTNPVWKPTPGGTIPRAADRPREEQINHFAFTANGTELVLCGPGGARFVEPHTGNEIRRTIWGEDSIAAGRKCPVAITPDGRLCLVASGYGENWTLTLRETATGKAGPAFTLAPEGAWGDGIVLSPDGGRAAYLARETVHVLDLPAGTPATTFHYGKLPTSPPSVHYCCLSFSPDGRLLYIGSATGEIRRFDVVAGKELAPLRGHSRQVTGVHPTPDGRRLVSAGWDGRIRRFDLDTGAELPAPDGYEPWLPLAGSPDGSRFAVGGRNGRLEVFDAAGRFDRTLQTAGSPLQHLTFTPGGTSLAAYELTGRFRYWNAGDWSEQAPFDLQLSADDRYVRLPAFSPDGRRLLTGTEKVALVCWDLARRAEVWRQPGHRSGTFPNLAVYSPDGSFVLSGGWDKAVTWRNPETGAVRRSVPVGDVGQGDATSVNQITFAPDGETFLTTHHDGTVRRWDAETGKPVAVLKGHAEVVWWARFSPDGKWIASGSIDRTVRIWEAATATEVCRLTGHDHWVGDGAWLAGGRALVTSSGPEALVWDLRAGASGSVADVSGLWDGLAADPVTAYRAQWALLADPKVAAALIRERQPVPTAAPDDGPVRRLVADLDADAFRTRERAARSLREIGPPARPYLRAARAGASPEARQRIDELLAGLPPAGPPADLRALRAIQVLELAGTPEATGVLREWARGPAGTVLTGEASAALARLGARRP